MALRAAESLLLQRRNSVCRSTPLEWVRPPTTYGRSIHAKSPGPLQGCLQNEHESRASGRCQTADRPWPPLDFLCGELLRAGAFRDEDLRRNQGLNGRNGGRNALYSDSLPSHLPFIVVQRSHERNSLLP